MNQDRSDRSRVVEADSGGPGRGGWDTPSGTQSCPIGSVGSTCDGGACARSGTSPLPNIFLPIICGFLDFPHPAGPPPWPTTVCHETSWAGPPE
ncbi:MAG: hypothetical protein QM758_13120 [Armatimonas sp.]